MKMPFYDYSCINKKLKIDILKEMNTIIDLSDNISHESYTKLFEQEYADFCGIDYAIGTDSGTSAIQLSLLALGIGKDDEVILPAYTYIATAVAISNTGAKPVFVDINAYDLTINPEDIENKLSAKTKAVIAVHIHGNMCDMDRIMRICKIRSLSLIEDASQSHGAEYNGRKAGSFGIGAFSMHTSKTLGGIGDSGIITTDDAEIANKILELICTDQQSEKILFSGRTPCKMDAIQAGILKIKLKHLDSFNSRKRDIAHLYNSNINNKRVKKLMPDKNSLPVYRDYCLIAEDKESLYELQKHLLSHGIETKRRYPKPLYMTKAYSDLNIQDNEASRCKTTEQIAGNVLCLPSYIGLTDENVVYICDVINKWKEG